MVNENDGGISYLVELRWFQITYWSADKSILSLDIQILSEQIFEQFPAYQYDNDR